MNCPDCQGKDTDVLETRAADKGLGYRRRHRCLACGTRWTMRATIEPGSIANATGRVVASQLNATRSVQSSRPPPTGSVNPPTGSVGGIRGGVSSGLVLSGISDPSPGSVSDPNRGRARSSRSANAEYPQQFEIVWEQTGRRGGKFPAFKAWKKNGQPTWVDVQAPWRAYLLSERPIAGFVQDLSTWLNARGHRQEWAPAKPAAVDLRCRFHRLPNTRGKLPDRAPPLEGCPECRHAKAANGARQSEPQAFEDLMPAWAMKYTPPTPEQMEELSAQRKAASRG